MNTREVTREELEGILETDGRFSQIMYLTDLPETPPDGCVGVIGNEWVVVKEKND